jgi:hypothetical protein
LLKQLTKQNDHVLVDLMKAFMVLLFILQLIQEILDFKSWILGYLKLDLDDPKVLTGHIDALVFYAIVFGW